MPRLRAAAAPPFASDGRVSRQIRASARRPAAAIRGSASVEPSSTRSSSQSLLGLRSNARDRLEKVGFSVEERRDHGDPRHDLAEPPAKRATPAAGRARPPPGSARLAARTGPAEAVRSAASA